MDIMELGAIGELVGGVAVIATLIYLAVQIRQNVKQLKLSSLQAAVVGYAERIEGILADEDRFPVFSEGLKDFASLPPNKRAKFHGMMIGNLSVFENNLNLYRSGVLPAEQIVVYERDVVAILKSPGASFWWSQIKEAYFSVSLKEHVDRILDSMGPDVPPLSESLELMGSGEIAAEGA